MAPMMSTAGQGGLYGFFRRAGKEKPRWLTRPGRIRTG